MMKSKKINRVKEHRSETNLTTYGSTEKSVAEKTCTNETRELTGEEEERNTVMHDGSNDCFTETPLRATLRYPASGFRKKRRKPLEALQNCRMELFFLLQHAYLGGKTASQLIRKGEAQIGRPDSCKKGIPQLW